MISPEGKSHNALLQVEDLKEAKLADTTVVFDAKGVEQSVKYDAIKFNNLFPKTTNKKQLQENAKVIEKIKIDAAKNSINIEKSFLGIKINDLHSFFMLFVYLAGGAAIVLFFLSKPLLKMMHGVK